MLQNYHEDQNLNLLTGVLSQLQIQDLATVDNDLQMSLQMSMVFGQEPRGSCTCTRNLGYSYRRTGMDALGDMENTSAFLKP